MKTNLKLLIGGTAMALATASASGEGLLGKRYIELGVATDADAEDFIFGGGFNTNIASGVDFGLSLATTEGNDVRTGVIDLPLYTQIAQAANAVLFFTPAIGYIDVGEGGASDLVYGAGLGAEFVLDGASSITLGGVYMESDDFGDLGYEIGAEYNYWFTERFGAGISALYHTELDDTTYGLTGRWSF